MAFFSRNKSLKPQLLLWSKILCSRGRRRSPSINSTLRPISASAIPRLLTTVVLPSVGQELVITKTCGWSSLWLADRMEASVARNDSDRAETGCSKEARSTCSFPLAGLAKRNAANLRLSALGMAPSSGSVRYAPASPGASAAHDP